MGTKSVCEVLKIVVSGYKCPITLSYCFNYKPIIAGTIITNLWMKKQSLRDQQACPVTKLYGYEAMIQKQSVLIPEPITFPICQ